MSAGGKQSRVIDADAHVVEGAVFMAEAARRWPDKIRFAAVDGTVRIEVEGRRYPESQGPGAGCPPEHGISKAAGGNPGSQQGVLADADREGIDRMVLFPSFGLGIPSFRDPAFTNGIASLYNEWVADWCRAGQGRLAAAAVVPIEDTDAAIEALRQAKSLGLVCATVPPALRERNLDHPDLDRFYAVAEDLNLPLAVHGAPGVHLPKIGVDRFTNYIQVHCISFPFDMMTAMTAVVTGGVLERHPRLRIAFLESGVGWVPYFIDRMGEHYEKRGDWIAGGWKRHPREYVERGQVYVTCEAEEPLLPAALADLGRDFVMYASDYPHWDSEFPRSRSNLAERGDLDERSLCAVLGENAARFFGLE
jgi:hypothetical protein